MTLEVETLPSSAGSPPTQEEGTDIQVGDALFPTTDKSASPEPPAPEAATAEDGEGKAPETEPEQEVEGDELPEGWQDHPAVKDAVANAYREAQSNADRVRDDAVAQTRQDTMDTLASVHAAELQEARQQGAAAALVTQFKEALDAALEFSSPEARQQLAAVLSRHKPWVDVYQGEVAEAVEQNILRGFLNSPEFAAGLDTDGKRRARAAIGEIGLKLRAGQIEPVLVSGAALAARDKIRDQVVIQNALKGKQTEINAIAKKAASVQARGEERSQRRAPVPTGGSAGRGGQRSEEEILRDPRTPVSTLMEIRARRKAGQQ